MQATTMCLISSARRQIETWAFCYYMQQKIASWGASRFELLTRQFSGDDMKEDEMGGACDTCAEEERRIQGFGGEGWRKESNRKT
jgi:hypothetical protein